MSTLGSWINPDELADLVSDLTRPASDPEPAAPEAEAVAAPLEIDPLFEIRYHDEADLPTGPPSESDRSADTPPAMRDLPVFPIGNESEPETSDEAAVSKIGTEPKRGEEAELEAPPLETSAADEGDPFPITDSVRMDAPCEAETECPPEDSAAVSGPDDLEAAFSEPGAITTDDYRPRRALAAESLEKARSRAQQGGLLKGGREIPSPPIAEAPPIESAADEEPFEMVEFDEIPAEAPKKAAPEPAPAPVPTSALPSHQKAAPSAGSGPSRLFRRRLREFADSVMTLAGGRDVTVTDFQSYRLHPAEEGSVVETTAAWLTRLLGALPVSFQAAPSGEGATQIALRDGGWLCILTAESASGGVCASFQAPAPLDAETAARVRAELRSALGAKVLREDH